jgi:two-component system NtrC family sensor kinase
MRWRSRSLAFRLAAKLLVGLAVVLAATAVLQISLQQRFAEGCATLNGLALAEVIYGSLHSTMRANERDQLQRSVVTISKQAPNLQVRIVNKEGKVAIASDPAQLGKHIKTNDRACVRCHKDGEPTSAVMPKPARRGKTARVSKTCFDPDQRTHTFRNAQGGRVLGIVRPIENQPSCAGSGCHASVKEEPLLGVLDVTLELSPAEKSRRDTTMLMGIAAAAALAMVVLVVLWVVRRAVQRPIRQLTTHLDALGDGDYSTRYEQRHNAHEFDQLGDALNQMARELERANAELVDWNQTLERRVEDKTAELRHAQDQMLRVERMASLGKLSAVVAHEINNPLASVVTYSKLLIRRMNKRIERAAETPGAEDKEGLEILEAIAGESARCGEIVTNLLLFARRTGAKQEPTDVNEIIGKALFLLKHKMDLAEVVAERQLADELPLIVCDPGQLEQALLALCVNAIEAMPSGGALKVCSAREPEQLRIEVADEGIGMSDDVRRHIFEPFYTTKEGDEGKGLGLGLSVVYGIVQRNRGTIEVDSELDAGTTFTLRFPLSPPDRTGDDAGDSSAGVDRTAAQRGEEPS